MCSLILREERLTQVLCYVSGDYSSSSLRVGKSLYPGPWSAHLQKKINERLKKNIYSTICPAYLTGLL